MNAKEIFQRLVERASCWSLYAGLRRKQHGKPGELIAALPPEDREELQNLGSKDIKDVDRNVLLYMIGQYPESTMTVHTHSIKKDEE